MPEDAKFPFEYDETGDVATVTGEAFYHQHALQVAHLSISDNVGEPLTANDVTDIVGDVRDGFRRSPYFNEPLSIQVREVSGGTVTIGVRLGSGEEFEIDVTAPDEDQT